MNYDDWARKQATRRKLKGLREFLHTLPTDTELWTEEHLESLADHIMWTEASA